jgi:coenzyme F420-0:L-glutamate ligase/coenzyme F420-1:gamma-L-glutamate ligase
VLSTVRRAWEREVGSGALGALGVVVSDTAGRPWRAGVVDFALGSAGVQVLKDHRGGVDADGRELSVTVIAVADEIAAAADLVKSKSGALPVALVRGLPWASEDPEEVGAGGLVRTGPGDWFRTGPVEAVRAALGVAPGSAESESVGVRAVGGLEEVGLRARRVLALALHGLGPDVTGSVSEGEVRVEAGSAYMLGRVVERVSVAAASEDLEVVRCEVKVEGLRALVTLESGWR